MDNPMSELEDRVAKASQVDVARQLGVSPQYLHDVLKKRRQVGKKILDAMGYERHMVYVKRKRK
jgi:hypothetical protein